MPYLIDATDKPGQTELRQKHRPEHLAFLTKSLPRLLAAGAKLADDGNGVLGSIYIVEVEDRASAEAFIGEDPYMKANLFQTVTITRWRKGFFNHESFIPKS